MTEPKITSLETLPLLILERICEYLDDESATRPSLLAFSLTSKGCRAAADAQRFSQVELRVSDPDGLESILRQWNDMLDGRHRHVRRLKISWKLTKGEMKRTTSRKDEESDEDEFRTSSGNVRPYFHMHDFLRPSEESLTCGGGTLADHPENWAPLGHFVSQFPGLQDLVWAAGQRVPPSVLSVISKGRCRLHHHTFGLPSLIQSRDSPQPISPAEYELCTSPSLFSIVVREGSFESGGKLNYVGEAVLCMVAGLAPNLAHMCDIPKEAAGEMEITQAILLGKPDWQGFFPGKSDTKTKAGPDRLRNTFQNLVFPDYVPRGIDYWARVTDLTDLRCLDIPWNLKDGIALADIASRGDMPSLQKMRLFSGYYSNEDETEEAQTALNLLLSSLNPLQRLEISGYISPETFDIITNRHGENLRFLSLNPSRDVRDDSRKPLVVFSAPVLQHFAEQCPQLTHFSIPINRTRGDKHEVGIYHALSRLPRLQYLSLELMYSVGPDEEFWDEERDGQWPLSREITEGDEKKIPAAYLQEAFTNGAIDEDLARKIFGVVSGEGRGTLRYLSLTPCRKVGFNAPGNFGWGQFQEILRAFGRPWVCKRDVGERDGVMVRERDLKGSKSAEKLWKYLFSDEEGWEGEEIFVDIFKSIWPQKTDEWWRDWSSLPLDLGERNELDELRREDEPLLHGFSNAKEKSTTDF